MLMERNLFMVSEKHLLFALLYQKQPMFAITERLFSKNKSTFSMLLHTNFLKASGNVLQ